MFVCLNNKAEMTNRTDKADIILGRRRKHEILRKEVFYVY